MKKLTALVGAVALLGAFAAPAAAPAATCSDGTSQTRDANGAPTGADTLGTLPDGGTVYGSSSDGYVGVTGPHGYIEYSGGSSSPQIDGQATEAPVGGTLNSGGLVLQGVTC